MTAVTTEQFKILPGQEACDDRFTATNMLWHRQALSSRDIVLAILLGVVALAARLPLILQGDVLLHGDEAVVGIMAQDIAELRRLPIYYYNQRYMGALEAYVVATLKLIGLEPLIALRLGPAFFFAGLVAVQSLMLTRWFGRTAGPLGAMSLIASSPMFAFWSITARGGYVEIFLIGSLLLWAYAEWFAVPGKSTSRRRFAFGVIIGLGLWINPMIVGFLATITLHYVFHLPLRHLSDWAKSRWPHSRLMRHRMSVFLLPVFGATILFLITLLFHGQVIEGKVVMSGLLTLVPPLLLVGIVGVPAVVVAYRFRKSWPKAVVNAAVDRYLPAIYGVSFGALPALIYVIRESLSNGPEEPSLPLMIRPFSSLAEPLTNIWHGMPMLLGAHPDSFLSLYLFGRDPVLNDLSPGFALALTTAKWLSASALIGVVCMLGTRVAPELQRAMRCESSCYSPTLLLIGGGIWFVLLYLFCAAVYDFHSIRYLLLLWTIIPGLIASWLLSSEKRFVIPCVIVLYGCWGLGQIGMLARIEEPHPLHALAHQVEATNIRYAFADGHDAPLLSFWTEQRVKIADWDHVWPRLVYLQAEVHRAGREENAHHYVVRVRDRDWQTLWPFPGGTPPELHRTLFGQLHAWVDGHPERLKEKRRLNDQYELWTLNEPLPQGRRAS